jgi:hypothetical protein
LGDEKLRLQALVAARGKIVMVVGHPFYVGGEDTSGRMTPTEQKDSR